MCTLAESRTTGKLASRTQVRGESGSPVFASREGPLPYDPACVFHLEMMISLAGRGKQHIGETWYALNLVHLDRNDGFQADHFRVHLVAARVRSVIFGSTDRAGSSWTPPVVLDHLRKCE